MISSGLSETLQRLAVRAASAVVARSRVDSPSLNAALLRRLSAEPGHPDSLLADPVFEVARVWETADACLGELEGDLLHPDLVAALDGATTERMPRDRKPYRHQHDAWTAARNGQSFLVTAGTGSGKTECFMLPMLDALLRDPAQGRLSGVRAIVIYPLNALIESQRERLAAWTDGLKARITFAMYNRLTPETPREVKQKASAELGDRRTIRETPPSILVTNVTMLEYLLLRAQDRTILGRSQGLLRWIVLDEAHNYLGAQAAEMALLLRRVRSAFGVLPEQVQLIATSATISEGDRTQDKLRRFVADLAGQDETRACVIQGKERPVMLPGDGIGDVIEPARLRELDARALWSTLAPHPRMQRLRRAMEQDSVSLEQAAQYLFDANSAEKRKAAQIILDAAALAEAPDAPDGRPVRLLPWRASLFQRALGGAWVCIDPQCSDRDAELRAADSGWGFGAVWLQQRDNCLCGAPCFELVACNECGTPHLRAGLESGAAARLVPAIAEEIDDFLVDAEPDSESDAPKVREEVLLRPPCGDREDRFVRLDTGDLFDNAPPEEERVTKLRLIENQALRGCCAGDSEARLTPLRYGPPFFLGNAFPILLEALAPPLEKPGLPMGGRRALSFSDSRQGTARLAAKLQQEAERTLTRAFLYHSVQEKHGLAPEDRARKERKLALFLADPDTFGDDIRRLQEELALTTRLAAWDHLIDLFSQQDELRHFAGDVWRERMRGGRQLAEEPAKLAEMFLFRELFRRPKVQNNPETMGLCRLAFPLLEQRARLNPVPEILREAGVDAEGWVGLALAAIDFGFRDNLAVDIPDGMVRWVAPRGGRLQGICASDLAPQDRPEGSRAWPGPKPTAGRPSRLLRLVYALSGGDWDVPADQDRAGEVLAALWQLITQTVARDVGRGAYRLDFSKAAVARLNQGWLCPITRRIFGYAPAARSPYGPTRAMEPMLLPALPVANAGGLDAASRSEIRQWCAASPEIAHLREKGLWTDLHDRVAEYPLFLRAQEHSAQVPRPVLADYEKSFKDGAINVLNCTTTMEMGVDIPNVSLVVNGNVPPSVSNYRQRVGRAGRRGEPVAFAATFCRDLPWDRSVFDDPARYLRTAIAAPRVQLDSPALIARHVHAALLGAFLRTQPEGFNLRTSTGAFFGAADGEDAPLASDAPVQLFLDWLRSDRLREGEVSQQLAMLTRATVLDGRDPLMLAAETAVFLEALLAHWRAEYGEVLARAVGAVEPEVKAAFTSRAKRMRGEFLLSELARRGFTPSYGFPVDVVRFDHLSGHDRDADAGLVSFNDSVGAPTRTLDVALREFAPGAEIVVDGLVHRSEGVLPAWSANADTSGLEDLQRLWECRVCYAFGLARHDPEVCPACEAAQLSRRKTLRPSGFLGRRTPHTGYESLGHVPYQIPRIAATGAPWQALPDSQAGRLRADSAGQVVALSSGQNGFGYALCLACGRAESETEEATYAMPPLPEAIRKHAPLAKSPETRLVKGFCPGGLTEPQRIQRHIRLVHATHTDVFELQLPVGAHRAAGLALGAALREALAERLGADAREIGVAAGPSKGPSGEVLTSLFLHDRAAQGAGLVTRLAEPDWFRACLERAASRLDCRQNCENGCPACVLRPDLSHAGEKMDRIGGHTVACSILERLDLPVALRVLGPQTQLLGGSLPAWLERQRRVGALSTVTLFLHGSPTEWDLAGWSVTGLLARLRESGIAATLVAGSAHLSGPQLDLAQRLDLYRLAGHAALAQTTSLPRAASAPILALVAGTFGRLAVAASDPADAIPGTLWGQGGRTVLVRGPALDAVAWQEVDGHRLVSLPSSNAWLLRLGNQLDGPVSRFGRMFWKAIEGDAPQVIATIRTQGVRSLDYTDRYLATPLALRLLLEVMTALPNGVQSTRVRVATARLDSREQTAWAIHHGFAEDALRRQVIQALLQRGAIVEMLSKAEIPHARRLRLELNDGSSITLLLDQGLGAWRSVGSPRHDFRSDPVRQAQALRTATFDVRVETASEAPMILEISAARADARLLAGQ